MTNRQQRSGLFVVGQWRTHCGMIVLQAATAAGELAYEVDRFKTFNSRQAATRWRDYRPESGRSWIDVDSLAVIPLPVPQDL
jgi:hypothetical protein